MTAEIRTFPAPPRITPAERSPGDALAHFAAIGVNLVALDDAVSRIEEIRFATRTPQHVREALGVPLRAARDALRAAVEFANRGEKL